MATQKQRGTLVDQITKLGLTQSISQGFLDVIIDGVSDNETPAELLARVENVETRGNANTVKIGGIENTITTFEGKFTDIDAIGQRQQQAINVQNLEMVRLNDEINNNKIAHTDFTNRIEDLESFNTLIDGQFQFYNDYLDSNDTTNLTQDGRLTTLEGLVTGNETGGLKDLTSKLVLKSDLVNGKVPIDQLPELPTGRKVTVENEAGRLGLPVHNDITIAYQTSDALVYILAANADPSVASGWQRLGNTAGSGVVSFNGRAGVVVPAEGDYTTAMVPATPERQYITMNDRTRWDDKATSTQVISGDANVTLYVDNNFVRKDTPSFVPTSSRGQANGVASLGSDGKVPVSQLPELGATSAQLARLQQAESNALTANLKGDSAATNIKAVDDKFEAYRSQANGRLSTIEVTQENNSVNILSAISKNTSQDARLDALEAKSDSDGIPVSEKGANNGVAPLDSSGKVPLIHIPEAPTQNARVWRVQGRTHGVWYTNTTGREMVVMQRIAWANGSGRYARIGIRENPTSSEFTFQGVSLESAINYWSDVEAIVPAGWQYRHNAQNTSSYSAQYELS